MKNLLFIFHISTPPPPHGGFFCLSLFKENRQKNFSPVFWKFSGTQTGTQTNQALFLLNKIHRVIMAVGKRNEYALREYDIASKDYWLQVRISSLLFDSLTRIFFFKFSGATHIRKLSRGQDY